jgi:hypothetical protein
MRRTGLVFWLFIGIQVAIPLVMLVLRWTITGGRCLPFGWHDPSAIRRDDGG